MLKFNQYLAEQYASIDTDSNILKNNFDQINSELDVLTEKPYRNAPVFLSQLRGFGDRYNIMLPATATKEFLNLDAELIYSLGSSGYYLYVVYDTNDDGTVNGYAQVVTDDELSELVNTDSSELMNRETMTKKPWIPPARRDDDSGNGSAADYANPDFQT